MLNTVKGGHWPWGWSFGENDVGHIIPCFVWCDGKSQTSLLTPLSQPQGYERWWPCIVIAGPGDEWPFYCPALAWGGYNGSRAWGVHSSRVRARRFIEDSPYIPFSGPGYTLGGSSTPGSESGATDDESSHTSMSWTTAAPFSSDSCSSVGSEDQTSDPAEEEGWEILD